MYRLFTTAALGALLTAGPVQAFDITDMSDAEREAFRAEVRDFLMEQPQVILDAVDALEAQQMEAQAEADQSLVSDNAEAIYQDGYSWVGGNPDGDITVVEFMDYRCGYCRRAKDAVEELVETDGNIRFVIKEFPILGEASLLSSRFAVAVQQIAGDDAYKAAHDLLMELSSDMTEPVLRRLAETLELDPDEVLAAMDSDAVTEELAQTRALAQTLNISGTPSFVMGDEMVRGYVPLEEMRSVVEEARADG